MTPTNKLRFVEREVHVPSLVYDAPDSKTIRVLQQWWEDKESSRFDPVGEWRDVPLEEDA